MQVVYWVVLCHSPYILLALFMLESTGRRIGKRHTSGHQRSFRAPEATKPIIHSDTQPCQRCALQLTLCEIRATFCCNSLFFLCCLETGQKLTQNSQACWSPNALTDVAFHSGSVPVSHGFRKGMNIFTLSSSSGMPKYELYKLLNIFYKYF